VLYTKLFDINRHDTSISISEDDNTYRLVAYFNANSTGKVQQYINDSIKPNGLFSSENDYMDVNTTLADKTEFYVKESPGKLKIAIDKRKNSYASYLRIKKMCNGIKDILAGK
jgi:hypothetical protein